MRDEFPGYDTAFTMSPGGGYDWSELRIYKKRADGRVFYLQASGCSCNYWDDFGYTPTDMIELQTLRAASEVARDFVVGERYSYDDQITPYVDAVEKFRELGLR